MSQHSGRDKVRVVNQRGWLEEGEISDGTGQTYERENAYCGIGFIIHQGNNGVQGRRSDLVFFFSFFLKSVYVVNGLRLDDR